MVSIMNQSDAYHKDGFFEGHDGLKLYYETWTTKPSKGVIVVSHGFAEHSGRYVHFAEYFLKHGYSVYVPNHRGHGKSEGERAFVNKFDDFVSDLKLFIEQVKQWENVDKVFLVGHSMGGAIALRYALKYPDDLKTVITSGAGLILTANVSGFLRMMAKFLSKIVPKMKIESKIDPNILTHDKEIAQKYANDPLVFKFTTVRLGAEMFSAGDDTLKQAHKLKVPILILHGGEDMLVSPRGSQIFFEKVPIEDKKLIIYPGLYHEIFNEIEREKVLKDVLDWVEKHL